MIPLILGIAALYLAICLLAFLGQRRLVYHPSRPSGARPEDLGLEYEDLTLVTSDGVRIHAWYFPVERAERVVLMCHGNAGSIEDRLGHAEAITRMGQSFLIFDYRGYGRSEGKPDEEGTYRDSEAAYDWLRERGYRSEQIVAFGVSLGAAIAVELACRRELAALVIDSAFSSMLDVGRETYPWLPVRYILRIDYDSVSKIGGVDIPFLVFHSAGDRLIPIEQARRLYEAAPGPKKFVETVGEHGDGSYLFRDEWLGEVESFIVSAGESLGAKAKK